jgi:hypothetical protein
MTTWACFVLFSVSSHTTSIFDLLLSHVLERSSDLLGTKPEAASPA